MAYTLPNGSTIDLASAYNAVVEVTGVSNANPAVATAVAHGLAEGDIVLITSGWSRINNRAFRVGAVTTDTFVLEGVNSTNTTFYPVGGGIGTAKSTDTYVTINQVTAVEFAGGDINFLDVQFLESDTQVQLPTVKSAISMTLTVADDPDQPYVSVVEGYDESREIQVLRLNLVNGNTILYTAIVTASNTPTVTINELLTRTISLAVQGTPTRFKNA